MEDDAAVDDLPLLEEVDAPALDERVIADEESRRDSRDTPLRQTPIIQSIHCGCYLGRMIDVKAVARRLWNATFDPKRSQHGVLVALRHPRVSVCVFPSGKVISMGAKSEASAIIGCRKVARMIQRLPGYDAVRVSDFKVHNVTASGALGYRIDLRALARHPMHEDHVEYNPDQFPGLHYKLVDSSRSTATHPLLNVKPEPGSASAVSQPSHVASSSSSTPSLAPAASSSSSLTLTLYFSGRFTLVGAHHELDVYRHFDTISKALFTFSHVHTKQAMQQQGALPADSKQQQFGYAVWLEASKRDERARGGRMGWEEEADRVRLEMAKRDSKRRTQLAAAQPAASAPVRGGEMRVKAEPGTVAAGEREVRDEVKEETRGAPVAQQTATVHAGSTESKEADTKETKSGQQEEKKARDERKEGKEENIGDGAAGKFSATTTPVPVDSSAVVASHTGEDDESGDVDWE